MEAGFFVLVFVGVVMGPGRVSLWGCFYKNRPIDLGNFLNKMELTKPHLDRMG